jgi:hypothetical protein
MTRYLQVVYVVDLDNAEDTVIARSSPSDLDTNELSAPDEVDSGEPLMVCNSKL